VQIVTGPKNQKGFIVQKRRWVVERSIAWINVNRRLAKDYERHASTALAFVVLAGAFGLLQRICRWPFWRWLYWTTKVGASPINSKGYGIMSHL
jgi:hypothetical protein